MQIRDRIYGTAAITDKLMVDIIQSEPMQRLGRINQHGSAAFVYPQLTVTRLEHSIGVSLLLKRFNASREEQIAGLLHDIGHTAFSHVIDFVLDNKEQDHHESLQEEVILDSELPHIFARHGYGCSDFLLDRKFTLLDAPVPELCCDRLDYFLRDYGAFYGKDKVQYLKWVKNDSGELYFTNKVEAKKFVQDFISMDNGLWGMCASSAAAYKIFADALRIALENDVITAYELEKLDDKEIISRLRNSSNLKLAVLVNKLQPGFSAELNEKEFDYHLPSHARWVDPKVRVGSELKNLSAVDAAVKAAIEKHLSMLDKGLYIKITS